MGIKQRIDAITQLGCGSLRADPPPPKSVKIEISPRCNYLCGFCALRTREEQPDTDMKFELFERITREMREAGVEEIGLFYLGESMMNRKLLLKCLQHVKATLKFPYVFLTSNASLAKPDFVRQLMAAGLDSLKWSVNAADEDQFESVMGVNRKLFEVALKNIAAAYEVRESGGYATGLYASSISYDGEQRAKMESLLAARIRPFVDESYWLPLYGMAMRSEAVKAHLGYTPTHGNAGRIDDATGLPNRAPLPCWSAFSEGHIRADGGMSVCCFGSDAHFDVANLNSTSFIEAWHAPKFREIREAQLRTVTEGASALRGTMCDVCVAY